MRIINCHNFFNTIYLFGRNVNDKRLVKVDKSFVPHFYHPASDGKYTGHDGTKLDKICVNSVQDIRNTATSDSFSSDIPFHKSYIINKVDKFIDTDFHYMFIDIEVLCGNSFPYPEKAKYPISCITTYSSMTKETKTFWAKDYNYDNKLTPKVELELLKDFIRYIKSTDIDILLAWNIDFDYTYLFNRLKQLKIDFSKSISPVNLSRYHKGIPKPIGIAIVDYLELFKKVFRSESCYKLDFVCNKYLGEQNWRETDFTTLDDIVRDKNINDVRRMLSIEQKFNILDYYNEIRILCKADWEDLSYNSLVVEMLLFDIAKKNNIILPNINRLNERLPYEGAARDVNKTGLLFDIGKFDLESAYPNMIVNFCLDPSNIVKEDDADQTGVEVNGTLIRQNKEAICSKMVKQLLTLKDYRKKELATLSTGTKEYKEYKRKYDAIKGVVNSAYGLFGLPTFRLYNSKIASSIAFLSRECLLYCKNGIESKGYNIIYWDTDSLFIEGKEDISTLLNNTITQWANSYNKSSVSTSFTFEGYFNKLFILGKCRYLGYLVNDAGEVEEEVKGMEIKRSSSSKFESSFQYELLNKVMNSKNYNHCLQYVVEQSDQIKNQKIKDIGFPCKFKDTTYKGLPIHIKALNNTNKIKKSTIKSGELYYYMFVSITHKGEVFDVMAFKDKPNFNNDNINWNRLTNRTIVNKTVKIFEAMGWDTSQITNLNQQMLNF